METKTDKEEFEKLKIDYKHTTEYFFHLANTRFRLLGFLPIITGSSILFTQTNNIAPLTSILFGLFGFLITIGLTIYDQRNTQIYDRLVKRAQLIESNLGLLIPSYSKINLGGAFIDRPKRRQLFGCDIIWHDLGLSIIYSSCIGAWLYILTVNLLTIINFNTKEQLFALLISVFFAIISFVILLVLAILNDNEEHKKENN